MLQATLYISYTNMKDICCFQKNYEFTYTTIHIHIGMKKSSGAIVVYLKDYNIIGIYLVAPNHTSNL